MLKFNELCKEITYIDEVEYKHKKNKAFFGGTSLGLYKSEYFPASVYKYTCIKIR